jgi:DNA repair protein RecN (Recombination protein N)
MLQELRIENFAIIDRLELHFGTGFVVFTGETGAGKSIIIDAVEILMGGRSDSGMLRAEADRAIVEGTFSVSEAVRPYVHSILEREDLLDDESTVILGREIRRNGRNIARVNGRTVSTSLLSEVGSFLVDVHGQSEHLSLLKVRQHQHLLDRFADVGESLAEYSRAYRRLQQVRRDLTQLQQAESDAARRADMLTYQINEIDTARLKAGEEEDLREERNRLANAEGLASITAEALLLLDEGDPETPSITDLFGKFSHSISSLARIDASQNSLDEQAQLIAENLSDLGISLRAYQENIEFNPKRLDQVEERLALLHTLKRKYGSDVEAILKFAEQARLQLEQINTAGERIQEMEEEEKSLLAELAQLGQQLSRERRKSAQELSARIEQELGDLHMGGARFAVDFQEKPDPNGVPLEDGRRVAFDASGLEQIEFLVAPNPGEGLKPLVKVASGGETSRLMLALKNVLAGADQVPTLIFDEIDQGIGGRVGTVVGRKLWSLARSHQVLCITHLPQLAAFGEQHYRVQKVVEGGRTHTVVEPVDGEERLLELAQMMGGVSDGTRQSARELLSQVALQNQ